MEIFVSRSKIVISSVFFALSLWSFHEYLTFLEGLDNLINPEIFPTMVYLLYYLVFSIIFGWAMVGECGAHLLTIGSRFRIFKWLTETRAFSYSMKDLKDNPMVVVSMMIPVTAGIAFKFIGTLKLSSAKPFDYFFYFAVGWAGASYLAYYFFYVYLWKSRRQYKEERTISLRNGPILVSFDILWFSFAMMYATHMLIAAKMYALHPNPIHLIVGFLPLLMYCMMLTSLMLHVAGYFISKIFTSR